ncbi:protein FAM210A isoform X1 [Osmia bicornis bicornis]|uniref:protein FAM210A isoform X1 n=1 Tax=Osmia bicornis bicornis TaxID=1437191 RepID=UPI001EAF7988|nr:protein FAM210A isoform X1 [Osmia bicornis bicornis]
MEVLSFRGIRFASRLGFTPLLATKSLLESTCFMRCTDPRRWKFRLSEKHLHHRNLSCNYAPFFNRINAREVPVQYKFNKNILVTRYCQSKTNKDVGKDSTTAEPKKVSVFARMKQMTKDYWHVLIPVHVVTSIGWMVMFYATIKNGVDIIKVMEYLSFSDKYLDMVRKSSAGNWALAYVLFKIFTPLRYTVTIGATTMAIKQLSKSGFVKPLPFGKQSQVYKTTESNKRTTTTSKQFKVERETEPPKT